MSSTRSVIPAPQLRQQQCLGDGGTLEHTQVQALVDAVGLGAGSSTPVTRILARGKAAANSAMNGMDPPIPMSTTSVPQASRNAARAAA